MKAALPLHAKLSKESRECVQECVLEFIAFVTSQAADTCMQEQRKTLHGEDVLAAMATLGFENYAEVLKVYLARFREADADEAEVRRQKRRDRVARRKAHAQGGDGGVSGSTGDSDYSLGISPTSPGYDTFFE